MHFGSNFLLLEILMNSLKAEGVSSLENQVGKQLNTAGGWIQKSTCTD